MASQKWDFVAIQAFGIGTLTAPVNKMIDAGIPVIDMDTLIAPLDTIKVLTFLAPDNEFMGLRSPRRSSTQSTAKVRSS
jgi:ribose transport system substrate-binding protein